MKGNPIEVCPVGFSLTGLVLIFVTVLRYSFLSVVCPRMRGEFLSFLLKIVSDVCMKIGMIFEMLSVFGAWLAKISLR